MLFLNFFKGLFGLFSNRKVKSETKSITKYYDDFIDDFENKYAKAYRRDILDDFIEDVEDDFIEDVEDELDTKKIKTAAKNIINYIKDDLEGLKEDFDGVFEDITLEKIKKEYSSILAMIITLQISIKIPICQEMLKDEDLSKRFTWIPKEYRNNVKKWYSSHNSEFSGDPRKAFSLILQEKEFKNLNKNIKQFIEIYTKDISSNYKKDKEFKNGDEEWLTELSKGLLVSYIQLIISIDTLITNTSEKKLRILISKEIIKELEKNYKKIRNKQDMDDKKSKDSEKPKDAEKTKDSEKSSVKGDSKKHHKKSKSHTKNKKRRKKS